MIITKEGKVPEDLQRVYGGSCHICSCEFQCGPHEISVSFDFGTVNYARCPCCNCNMVRIHKIGEKPSLGSPGFVYKEKADIPIEVNPKYYMYCKRCGAAQEVCPLGVCGSIVSSCKCGAYDWDWSKS